MQGDRSSSVQDEFFARARKEGGILTVYLTNGKKLTGRLKAFDKFTVVLECNRVEQMLFKHAISTLVLGRVPHGPDDRPLQDEPRARPTEDAD
jgi:host factor-I protein